MIHFPDGIVYEGEFYKDMMHGDAVLRYPDGTEHKCKFVNDVL